MGVFHRAPNPSGFSLTVGNGVRHPSRSAGTSCLTNRLDATLPILACLAAGHGTSFNLMVKQCLVRCIDHIGAAAKGLVSLTLAPVHGLFCASAPVWMASMMAGRTAKLFVAAYISMHELESTRRKTAS
jgi:hypothetical protein